MGKKKPRRATKGTKSPNGNQALEYIKNGVSVFNFFKHFKGEFKGKLYDCPYPPEIFLENSKICDLYEDFISSTIIERVKNRPVSIWGREGQCEPPVPIWFFL